MVDKVKFGDEKQWGLLVKTWATGQDRIQNGHDFSQKPRTIAEFKQQTDWAGAAAIVPDSVTGIVFVQGDASTLVIRLPPASMILAAEQGLAQGIPYELPSFYSTDAFNNAQPHIDDLLSFHAKRIGEYTINNCQ
jgi:hypothetical protein